MKNLRDLEKREKH